MNYDTGRMKLQEEVFTTFRFPRKDLDWKLGERVLVVIRTRSPDRDDIGLAEIIAVEPRALARLGNRVPECIPPRVVDIECLRDGFQSYDEMYSWACKTYSETRLCYEPMNKLTLKWYRDAEV
jgi:hypothetical protein